MRIEEAFARFVGKDCLLYTVNIGALQYSIIDYVVEEIGDGWVRISEHNGKDERSDSIVNVQNIVRIREYPLNKNGKKKMIF